MTPLAGIRVVEAATLFAAAVAGMLLADYGADVVKLEHPRRPDPARGHGPGGLWFRSLTRNKRLATLDLAHTEGRELFLQLVVGIQLDVIIGRHRSPVLRRPVP